MINTADVLCGQAANLCQQPEAAEAACKSFHRVLISLTNWNLFMICFLICESFHAITFVSAFCAF